MKPELRGFAPSREPVISARQALLPPSPRQASQPARTSGSATLDGSARGRRTPAKADTFDGLPGAASDSFARIANRETALKSAKASLCASRTSAFFFS
ncbi:MAG: hypothetical protein ACYDHX_16480 [Methanothrix sp.]